MWPWTGMTSGAHAQKDNKSITVFKQEKYCLANVGVGVHNEAEVTGRSVILV
jgi:hypothetical protein